MSKVLVVVESPAKAKTIEKFLGRRYSVKASMGHVRDLPKSQFGVDLDHDFEPKYINIRGKGDIIKELRTAAKKSTQVLLAADPDREGEAIAWHLQHILNLEPGEPCRIVFNEITKNAIVHAAKNPKPIDQDLVDAQQARRVLDRIVGYKLSPLLWRKIRRGLSAGRVQSVAVRLICDREKEILAFVPEEYWSITGQLYPSAEKQKKNKFAAKLMSINGKKIAIPNETTVQGILGDLKQASFIIDHIKTRDTARKPAPPFTTSTLQQEAYRKLNFTARRTMRVAQQLYEGLSLGQEGIVGLISYIRTDSTRISPEIQNLARNYIADKFGPDFIPKEPQNFAKGKKAQDAHEAIRPTTIERTPDTIKALLTAEQYKLYRLIWDRFVASQMSEAILALTRVDIQGTNPDSQTKYLFRANGSVMKFPGFTQVYVEGRDEEGKDGETKLPPLSEGEELSVAKMEPKQHFTQPPPRYGEATLVKTMEERGLGRPSTYAPTIETIVSRGYVLRQEKQFVPTDLGMLVVEMLKEYFPDIIDITFTAALEEKLDSIEEGSLQWKKVIEDFYHPFKATLDFADDQIGRVELTDEESDVPCPNCDRLMVIKHGPFGKFLACPGFPECQTTKPILEEIGVACPRCEKPIVVRHSKKGRKFYGCSGFPDCNFVAWDLPVNEKCPECGSLMAEKNTKTKGKYLVCTNKECSSAPNPAEKSKAAAKKSPQPRTTKSRGKTTGKTTSTKSAGKPSRTPKSAKA